MGTLRSYLAKTPLLGQALLIPYRAIITAPYFSRPAANFTRWLFSSKETTNFTYDLEPANKHYLASLISDITKTDYELVLSYFKEIEEDTEFLFHVVSLTRQKGKAYKSDLTPRICRRIGWYAFARILKPRVIIETGVDKGLGSCVLAAALNRNRLEGFEGKYYGTDIDPEAGFLLADRYAQCGQILYGDSIKSLEALDEKIDLFINDSDHSADYEAREYETIAPKLSENAFILGDNSHYTDKLQKFALKTGRSFLFFKEAPLNHWYPGAGIGIAFRRKQ